MLTLRQEQQQAWATLNSSMSPPPHFKAEESHSERSPRLSRLLDRRLNSYSARTTTSRKRVGSDDERLKKNRKIVDNHLRRISPMIGKELSLSAEGVAYFPYSKFVVVVEVPEDNPSVCYIYTMVCRLEASDNISEVLRLSMELNYMQHGTRGATLGLDGEEVNLCYSVLVSGLTFCDLQASLTDFMHTAVVINEQLDVVKALPVRHHRNRADTHYSM